MVYSVIVVCVWAVGHSRHEGLTWSYSDRSAHRLYGVVQWCFKALKKAIDRQLEEGLMRR